jgi:hypothetical protein
MTREEAVNLMKTSKNVAEWNSNREKVKSSPNSSNNVAFIDTSGLIVQVLPKK